MSTPVGRSLGPKDPHVEVPLEANCFTVLHADATCHGPTPYNIYTFSVKGKALAKLGLLVGRTNYTISNLYQESFSFYLSFLVVGP